MDYRAVVESFAVGVIAIQWWIIHCLQKHLDEPGVKALKDDHFPTPESEG